MKPRLTFKKLPERNGLMRLPKRYAVRRAGVELATIQEFSGKPDIWFWYGDGRNTAGHPCSLEECKRQIKEYFKI